MADLLGTTLNVVQLSKAVIGYIDAVHGGGKDRQTIRVKIEAAGQVISALNQAAQNTPQSSPSFQQLQSISCPGVDGSPSPIDLYETILRKIKRKLEAKAHDKRMLHEFRKLKFKASWPFEQAEVKDMVLDLESLQSSFQSVLQAVLGGMILNLKDSVNDSVTMLAAKLEQASGWQSQLHDSDNADMLESKIDDLQSWLTEFLDWRNNDGLGFKLDQIQGCLTKFLDWKLDDTLGTKLDRLQDGQDKLLRARDQEDFEKACARLSHLSPSSEFERLLRACEGSKPSWIFENPTFEHWRTDTFSRVLWAKGSPGAGKSVLAAVVAERLREAASSSSTPRSSDDLRSTGGQTSIPKTCVAVFFFKYHERMNADNMLGCVAKQLLEQGGSELWQAKGARIAARLEDQRLDVRTLLRELLSYFDHAFVVIDALDECAFNDQNDTVDSLRWLLEMSPSLYVMVTSRADMEKYFSGRGCLHHAERVEVFARSDDVLAYVEAKMEQKANQSDTAVSELDKKARDEIVRKVVEHTDGVFLVAVRHVNRLGDYEDQHNLEEAVRNLSSNLGEIYDRDLERVDAQIESKKKLGRRALLWTLNMKRPLRMEQLREALAAYDSKGDLDIGHRSTKASILDTTKGLIQVDEESDVLSVHKSLSDYFASREKKIETFGSDPDLEMARICMKYLCFSRFAHSVVGDSETMNPSLRRELHNRVFRNPLSLYAAQCWGWHANGDNEVLLMDDILGFFHSGDHLRSAIELWGCLGPKKDFHGYSGASDGFAAFDLAYWFGLEKTLVRLFKGGNVIAIDYSPAFVKESYSWDEVLAGVPVANSAE